MRDLAATNNEIIKEKTPEFLNEVHANELAMNIKHDRTKTQKKPVAKYMKGGSEIVKVSVGLTKGLIFTHKGVGKSADNRKAKPFYNPPAEKYVNSLADALAVNTGNTIAGNMLIP